MGEKRFLPLAHVHAKKARKKEALEEVKEGDTEERKLGRRWKWQKKRKRGKMLQERGRRDLSSSREEERRGRAYKRWKISVARERERRRR